MYLVAGGSGFLGHNLVLRLIKDKKPVRVFDKDNQAPIRGVEFFKGDINNSKDLNKAMDGCEVVYSLVSLLPCSQAGKGFEKVNTDGTRNLLEVALKNRVKKVIHVSSSIVYGIPQKEQISEEDHPEPIGKYAKSKHTAEDICREYIKKGLDITIIRPRFIVGPGRLGLLSILFEWVRLGKNIYTIGSGNNYFQMIGVDDLVSACILAEKHPGPGLYNIGGNNTPTVKNMLEGLVKHAGTKSKIIPINSFLAKSTLFIIDKLGISPMGPEHYLIADQNYILDTSKAKKELGWVSKENQTEMLIKSYNYYIKNRDRFNKNSKANFPKEKILNLIKFFS